MDHVSIAILVVGGLLVLGSYVWVGVKSTGGLIGNPWWLEFPRGVVIGILGLQALAVAGFLTVAARLVFFAPPTSTFLAKPGAMPAVFGVFLGGAALWAVAMQLRWPKWVVSASLVATAVATIALLAGVAEEGAVDPYAFFGALALAVITVLCDGVAWNARFVKRGVAS